MRSVIYLIVLAAAAYLGFNFYQEKVAQNDPQNAATEESADADPATAPDGTPIKQPEVFKSKIVIPAGPPGQKHFAPPGVFYVLERTSIEHESGVAAIIPGEEVKLLERKPNGMLKVISGRYTFELLESQLTNDLEVAQAAEKKFALTHPVARRPVAATPQPLPQ